MGARDTHIPSTVMVAMVVILSLKSRKTEPRTSSQSPAHSLRSSQRSSVAFLIRRGDGADQTPALISLIESRVLYTQDGTRIEKVEARWGGNGRGYRH